MHILKKLCLLVVLGWLPLAAQLYPELCSVSGTLTAVGSSAVINNSVPGCTDWVFTYGATGFSALSIEVQDAPLSATVGTPGTWETFAGAVSTGANPSTVTTQAYSVLAGYYPYMKVKLTAITGTGSVSYRLMGVRKTARIGGGGGGGGAPSGPAGGSLAGTYPNPSLAVTGVTGGTYGSATQSPTYTVSSDGRITSAANVTITGGGGGAPSGPAGGVLGGTYPNPAFGASTGSGSVVLATSPTLGTPNLGTPSAVVLTSGTGLPISTGVTGLATGIATFLGTSSSANLAATVPDETGSGALVFGTSPTLVTPAIASLTNAQHDHSNAAGGGTLATSTLIPPLNQIGAAVASQAGIANANNTIVWNWDTLASGTALKLASASTAAASNTQTVLNVAASGANAASTQTTYGSQISNTHTGTASTTVGLNVSASGGTNNIALQIAAGTVTLPAGTVSAPILTLGDTGSGLYRPTTNQIAIATNGVVGLLVDANQAVTAGGVKIGPNAGDPIIGQALTGSITINNGGSSKRTEFSSNTTSMAGFSDGKTYLGKGTSNSPTYGLEMTPTSGLTAGLTVKFQDATATTGQTGIVFQDGAVTNNKIVDIRNNAGTSKFSVDGNTGALTTSGNISATSGAGIFSTLSVASGTSTFNQIQIGAGLGYYWVGRSGLTSPSDGLVSLTNNAGTSFTRLQLGGTTSSFPALGRSNAQLVAQLADGSGDAYFQMKAASLPNTGAAPTVGNAILVAGTVTVATTAATSTAVIMLSRKTSGGTIGTGADYTISAGTSFTITSNNVLDTSTYSWLITEVH